MRAAPALVITASDIAAHGSMPRVIDALETAFAAQFRGELDSPPRTIVLTGSENAPRQMLCSPIVLPSLSLASLKVTTLTPDNAKRGLPLIHGVVILIDLETGRPTAIIDGAALTALRTGATAGLVTRLLAREDVRELAIIGAGVQARALFDAVTAVRGITAVRLYSRTPASAQAFAGWIRNRRPEMIVTVAHDIRAAVAGAEVICTATSTHSASPLVAAEWIVPGAHVNVIGGAHEDAQEVDPRVLREAMVVVELRDAALDEAGEIRAAIADGMIEAGALVEIGALLSGAPRPARGTTTLFRSVGCALEDAAAAGAIHQLVQNAGGGTRIDL